MQHWFRFTTICKCRRMLLVVLMYSLLESVLPTVIVAGNIRSHCLGGELLGPFIRQWQLEYSTHCLLLLLLHLVEAIMGPLNSCIPKRRSLPPLLPSWSWFYDQQPTYLIKILKNVQFGQLLLLYCGVFR